MEVTNQPTPYVKGAEKIEAIAPKEPGIFKENHYQDTAKPITKDMLEDKIAIVNEMLEPAATNVKFQLHEQLEVYYVQVIDTKTDEVLREIPNRKFLDMYASMAELAGIIIDEKR